MGLGAIVCGSCLFRSNLKALVGCLYSPEDNRRTPGFMLFYSASNLGGFCAALMCGTVAAIYGYNAGFGLAALGMSLSLALFLKNSNQISVMKIQDLVDGKLVPLLVITTLIVGSVLYHFQQFQPLIIVLTSFCFLIVLFLLQYKVREKRTFFKMITLLVLLITYFFFEELNGSLLMFFCEKHVDRQIFGLTIPSAFLAATNPLTIIAIGPMMSFGLRRIRMPLFFQCSLAFLCLSSSLLILHISALGSASFQAAATSFAAVAIGELFLAPTVYSFFSENATKKTEGLFMGTVTMAYAVAKLGSGFVGRLYSPSDLHALSLFFGQGAALTGLIFILLCIFGLKKQKTTVIG
jgi:POT family proton-dependent oligopeptide transporter